MFIAMFKKEIKQFFRSKANILLLFVFPIVLITTLGVGLKGMMTSGTDFFESKGESSKVYYSIVDEKDNKYKEGFQEFISGIEEELKVKFEKVTSRESIQGEVDEDQALLHINIKKDGFEIYTSKNGEKIKSKMMRSIFESVLNQYAVYDTIYEFNPSAMASIVKSEYIEYVEKEKLEGKGTLTSSEYYTFAELALIILFISITVGESVYKENQFKTINRIRLSKIKESVIIASKVSFGICIGVIQTLLIYVYSTYALDVDWGENTIKFIILFIVFSVFASVLGVIVGITAKKDTSVNSSLNGLIFAICALGGCYTPMSMIISIPIISKVMFISPIYWINTATSSMVCGFESDAYMIALLIPIVLSAICFLAYIGIMKKKGGLHSV